MSALLLMLCLAGADEGWRIHRVRGADAPTALSVRTDAVLGIDGGVGAVEMGGRFTAERFTLGLSLPVAWFDSPSGRRAGIGNLQLDGAALFRGERIVHRVGLDAWIQTNRDTFVWLHRAEQTWPSSGAVAAWEMRTQGETAWTARAWLGVLGTARRAPFRTAPLLGAAAGVDRTIIGPFGLAGELSMQWNDPSPIDLTAAARVEALPGLHLRTGLILPIGTWAGLGATGRPAGVREATWWFAVAFRVPPTE